MLAGDPAAEDRHLHVGEIGGVTSRDNYGVAARPRDPAGGNSEITTPTWVGSVVVCSVTAGTEPAFFSAVTAACPMTLGTAIPPVEAKIVTCDRAPPACRRRDSD